MNALKNKLMLSVTIGVLLVTTGCAPFFRGGPGGGGGGGPRYAEFKHAVDQTIEGKQTIKGELVVSRN
ncbi:hypothetical protein N8878_02310 [Psychromonas sp.]|nr:hypothetical protein [Psychromonas sp.]